MEIVFYRDKSRGIIEPKLFSDVAEREAARIADSGKNPRGRLESNKRTQLRKFYDEVTHLNSTVNSNPEDWENVLPYVNMLIAKAAYAEGRGKLVTREFVDMLKKCVAQVEQPRDLDVFASFFEAFIGFYRQYD